jgi:hypothetical protein
MSHHFGDWPEMEVDLNKGSVENNYSSFVKLIDDAEDALSKVTKQIFQPIFLLMNSKRMMGIKRFLK